MMEIPQRHKKLDKEKSIVALRKIGAYSAQACQFLEQLGYDITNLDGGIDA
jgi:rhodanese-related sulfurtransferase